MSTNNCLLCVLISFLVVEEEQENENVMFIKIGWQGESSTALPGVCGAHVN